jgi:hypothetical protein
MSHLTDLREILAVRRTPDHLRRWGAPERVADTRVVYLVTAEMIDWPCRSHGGTAS